jgi:hypothetical protein
MQVAMPIANATALFASAEGRLSLSEERTAVRRDEFDG